MFRLPAPPPAKQIDLAMAHEIYKGLLAMPRPDEVTKAPPKTTAAAREMIQRMIKENAAAIMPIRSSSSRPVGRRARIKTEQP
jgi:hypothetical protein